MLVGVDLALLKSNPGPLALLVMLASLGLYYAATDGVLAAFATGILPEERRRRAGWRCSTPRWRSAGWSRRSRSARCGGGRARASPVTTFLVGLVGALLLAAFLLRPMLRSTREKFAIRRLEPARRTG